MRTKRKERKRIEKDYYLKGLYICNPPKKILHDGHFSHQNLILYHYIYRNTTIHIITNYMCY